MSLTKAQLKKYRELYKERFGFDISKEEACEKAENLVRMVELVYKPMTKQELKQLQNRRKELKII